MLQKIIRICIPFLVICLLLSSIIIPVNAAKVRVIKEIVFDEERGTYVSISYPVKEEDGEIKESKTIDKIPLFNQLDYPDTLYGRGTIASSGCGITCAAMLASYYNDRLTLPTELALRFNDPKYNNLDRMNQALEYYNVPLQKMAYGIYGWREVIKALSNGQPVISLQYNGLFTEGEHFIVLAGLTEDGRVIVLDPNGYNYVKNPKLRYGFKHGFDDWQIADSSNGYWIFESKSEWLEKTTEENANVNNTELIELQ